MSKFKHIPKALWPNENRHVEYSEVYRAVKNVDALTVKDFLPWNVEYVNQKRTFKNTFQQPDYGMSVYTDIDALKSTVKKFPALNDSTNAYARGFTTIKRGISLKESKQHHVDYFLYDYEKNSPKDDFVIVEVRK